jgi:hypothetical protein
VITLDGLGQAPQINDSFFLKLHWLSRVAREEFSSDQLGSEQIYFVNLDLTRNVFR